ncbi:MAG: CPBP family intramembrane glutamic endopeptidase, partial [Halobacteriota archaeon]
RRSEQPDRVDPIDGSVDRRPDQTDRVDPIDGSVDRRPDQTDRFDPIDGSADRRPDQPDRVDPIDPSTGALLANVVVSQGLFATVLLAAAWLADVPATAFGASIETSGLDAIGIGITAGVVLYVLNEIGAAQAKQWGVSGTEDLRAGLAPETATGWAVLVLFVLPIIAGFEELLFRGILIGALSVGFEVSPWLLAIGSSIAFGLGHGAQGSIGVVVTGLLGFAFAWLFIVTGSLLAVVVAHYLVNLLEFVVHEGFGWEPFDTANL